MVSPKHKLTRSGRGWYKRVAGRVRWVCSAVVAPTGALADAVFEDKFKMLATMDNPTADRKRVVRTGDVINQFLAAKSAAQLAGKLKLRTLRDYEESMKVLARVIGVQTPVATLNPATFTYLARHLAKDFGIDRRAMHTVNIRSMFKWAEEIEFIDRRPRYGPEFKMPTRLERRRARAARRKRMGSLVYTADEIAAMLQAASPKMRAMILMMLNGGFRPIELIAITWYEIRDGWFRGDTAKHAIDREVPLWPETQIALASMHVRVAPPATARHVFLKRGGLPYAEDDVGELATAFWRMCKNAGLPNRGMYGLRRTFRTLADATNDQRAIARVMGREVGDIDTIYVQHVTPSRLIAVCDSVRSALTTTALSGWAQRATASRRKVRPHPHDIDSRLPASAAARSANT